VAKYLHKTTVSILNHSPIIMVAESLETMSAPVNGESEGEVANVRMRNNKPQSPLAGTAPINGTNGTNSANGTNGTNGTNGVQLTPAEVNNKAAAALSRSMAVLQEVPPELEESSEGQLPLNISVSSLFTIQYFITISHVLPTNIDKFCNFRSVTAVINLALPLPFSDLSLSL
jgi:hypothetical protein